MAPSVVRHSNPQPAARRSTFDARASAGKRGGDVVLDLGRTFGGSLLLGLDALPVHEHLVGTGDRDVAEHVRVAPDELGDDPLGHVVDVPPSLVGRHLRVEHDLEQEVAELVAEAVVVVAVDGVEDLVRLLQQVPGERPVILLGVPRAPAGTAQARHHAHEVEQPFAALGCRNRDRRERRAAGRISPGPLLRRGAVRRAHGPNAVGEGRAVAVEFNGTTAPVRGSSRP